MPRSFNYGLSRWSFLFESKDQVLPFGMDVNGFGSIFSRLMMVFFSLREDFGFGNLLIVVDDSCLGLENSAIRQGWSAASSL